MAGKSANMVDMEDTNIKKIDPQVSNQSPVKQDEEMKKSSLKIDKSICIRCATCAMMFPEYFEVLSDGTVVVKDVEIPENKKEEVRSVCPVGAIKAN